MNRSQKRKYIQSNHKRIQQLMASSIVTTDKFDNISEEELNLLKERKHTNKELQDYFNKHDRLVRELDYLLRKR
jgi:SOS response regulatory protein OraA/RecX